MPNRMASTEHECRSPEAGGGIGLTRWRRGNRPQSRVCQRFTPTTTQADPSKQPADNKLDRDFTADAPNRKWVTDITYLATATGWVYLAVVVDLFSRKAVGWAISTSLATELVSEALRDAIERRRPDGKQLLSFDRGCQYTSDAYQRTLRFGHHLSMSRRGCCYDNAVMPLLLSLARMDEP